MNRPQRRRISPRWAIGALCSVVAISGAARFMAAPPGGTRGDLNFDGGISVLDALAALQTSVGRALPAGMVADPNGDVDCNESVSSVDALIILSDIVGLDVSAFCIGQKLVAGVLLTPADTLFVGDTTRYVVTLLAEGGDTLSDTLPGRKVTWTTSDSLVATVDTTGLVTAVSIGIPTVVATSERVASAPTAVKIHAAVDTILVGPTSLSFNVFGAQQTLVATSKESGGSVISGVNHRWSSSDTLVARVSENGEVTAVGNGSAVVTASAGGVSTAVPIDVLQTISGICSISSGTMHSSNITTDTTWTKAASPHMVTANVDVTGGAVLTVEAGSIVCLGYSVDLDFVSGGRLVARGTPTDSVVFAAIDATNPWGRLGFFDAPADTSWITNAMIEDGGYPVSGMVETWNTHAVVVDSSMVVRSTSRGVYVAAPGTRVSRTTIDGTTSYDGVRFDASGVLEESTVGATGSIGVWVRASNTTVRDFEISATGSHGLSVAGSLTGIRVERGRIDGAAAEGLQVLSALDTLTDLRVVGSGSYGFRGLIENLNLLAPDSAAQDSIMGNARDTVVITGGTLSGAEQVVRPDLPWRVEGTVYVYDPGSRLTVRPGAHIAMGTSSQIYFDEGGELSARGTPTDSVYFEPVQPTDYWYGLVFRSPGVVDPLNPPPPDTSWITHAVLDRAGRSGAWAVDAQDQHVLLMDSVTVRDLDYYGVILRSPGSRISNSVVGPNTNSADGLYLQTGTTASNTTVRQISRDGIIVNGDDAVVKDFRVDTAGRYGVDVRCCSLTGVRVERGRIVGSGSEGLRAQSPLDTLADVRVVGSGSYGFRGLIENLNLLAPDSAAQDSIMGNARDTVVITGGTLRGAEQLVRPDFPWRVESTTYVYDPGGRLNVRPGAHVAMGTSTQVIFDEGADLWARGTPTDSVYFEPIQSPNFWYGFIFRSPGVADPLNPPPPDTSWITYAVLDRAGRSGIWAVDAQDEHVVLMDSVTVRDLDYNGVILRSSGSRISNSLVGPNANSGDGIYVQTGTTVTNTTVRQIGRDGIIVNGNDVVVQDFRVDTAGRYGVDVRCCSFTGVRVERGQIVGSGSEGLRAQSPMDTLADLRVVGSGSYGFRGPIQNLNLLAPDSAAQDSIMGNARDTVVITGGTLSGAEQVVRPDLPWRVESTTYVYNPGGLLNVRPGAHVAMGTSTQLYFDEGGELWARGTPTDSVYFEPIQSPSFWYGFVFRSGSPVDPFAPPPPDTSWLTYAVVDRAGRSGFWAVDAQQEHVLLMDSVAVRDLDYHGVLLTSAGSRISNSVVGPSANAGDGIHAQANVTVTNTTVRRMGRDGIIVNGNNVVVQDFRVDSVAQYGVDVRCCSLTGVRVERGQIVGSGSHGLRARSSMDTLADLRVVGSGSYGFYGLVENLHLLAPDSAAQDSLIGNARDTLVIYGGTLSGAEQVVRPDLPWRVDNEVRIYNAGGVLRVLPGATVAMNTSGQITFDLGGRLWARGTATDTVRFVSYSPPNFWYGLYFLGTPTDTSYVTNALLERGGRSGWAAIWGNTTTHPVVVDSSRVRLSSDYGIYLNGAGSRVSRTLVDSVLNYDGVRLGAHTRLENSIVRNANRDGVYIFGDTVVVDSTEVTSNGGDGIEVNQRRGVQVHNSNLFGNAGFQVRNRDLTDPAEEVHATSNWWGTAAGPTAGVEATANVDFTSFLLALVPIILP